MKHSYKRPRNHKCQSFFATKDFGSFSTQMEGNPREPVHVHVCSNEGEAKFFLHPTVYLVNSNGFDARALHELAEIVEQNAALIERKWNEYFC